MFSEPLALDRAALMTGAGFEPLADVTDPVFRRLSSWLARAFRGARGGRKGLSAIFQIAAQQMLEAGSSPQAVERVLEYCVLRHPACPIDDRRSIVTGQRISSAFVALIGPCVARVTASRHRFETSIGPAWGTSSSHGAPATSNWPK